MTVLGPLAPLRAHAGDRLTHGLDDASIERLAASHPALHAAIEAAGQDYARIAAEFGELLELDEAEQIRHLQAGFVNFYADDAVTPYVALSARGPWVVTLKGAVLYDAGGYGMLGFGHTPDGGAGGDGAATGDGQRDDPQPCRSCASSARCARRSATAAAAVRTAASCASTPAPKRWAWPARIVDINAKLQTDPGARHAGAKIKRLVVKGSFHGRTDRPGHVLRLQPQDLSAASGQLPRRRCADRHRALRRGGIAPRLRRGRAARLVHRGGVSGAGDGRRRPRPCPAAGVLRRRARA